MTKPLTLDDLARAISGAPYPSRASYTKARAILTTIKEAGWTIVPVEADEAMTAVAAAILDYGGTIAEAWQAMLDAAPQIEGE